MQATHSGLGSGRTLGRGDENFSSMPSRFRWSRHAPGVRLAEAEKLKENLVLVKVAAPKSEVR